MNAHFLVSIALVASSVYGVAEELIVSTKLKGGSFLRYSDQTAGRYLTFKIYRGGDLVRVLYGEVEHDGAFEAPATPRVSPDNNFMYLGQLEFAEVETPNGPRLHETAYCNLVDVRNGCIVARETGSFCGGSFTKDGKWDNSVYSDLDLADAAPKARSYAEGKLMPSDSPKTTIENLMACDPPSAANSKAYKHILFEKNLFNLDVIQLDALRVRLGR